MIIWKPTTFHAHSLYHMMTEIYCTMFTYAAVPVCTVSDTQAGTLTSNQPIFFAIFAHTFWDKSKNMADFYFPAYM